MSRIAKFTQSLLDATGLSSDERQRVKEGVLKAAQDEPLPTIVVIGESGVGKSSTINALFNAGNEVGHSAATTMLPSGVEVRSDLVKGSKGLLRVFDMPGMGDDATTYHRYRGWYLDILPIADAVLWVHPAVDRMLHYTQSVMEDLFVKNLPHMGNRVVFGLSKADEMSPKDWNPVANVPSAAQLSNLEHRTRDFSSKLAPYMPSTWDPAAVIPYAAEKRYALTALFKSLILAVPVQRRWMLEERMDLADFFALVDKRMFAVAKKLAHDSTSESTNGDSRARKQSDPHEATPMTQSQVSETIEERLARLSTADYTDLVSDRDKFASWLRNNGGPR